MWFRSNQGSHSKTRPPPRQGRNPRAPRLGAAGIRWRILVCSRPLSFRPKARGRSGEIWPRSATRPIRSQISRLRFAPLDMTKHALATAFPDPGGLCHRKPAAPPRLVPTPRRGEFATRTHGNHIWGRHDDHVGMVGNGRMGGVAIWAMPEAATCPRPRLPGYCVISQCAVRQLPACWRRDRQLP
jgi:hypothetical protein